MLLVHEKVAPGIGRETHIILEEVFNELGIQELRKNKLLPKPHFVKVDAS